MALMKVSITKRITFQGNSAEEFSNVYTYTVPSLNEDTARTLISGLVTAERGVYSTETLFVEGRAFTDKETQGFFDSFPETYLITDPAVSGLATLNQNIYRETAYLVRFPLARKRKIGGGLGRQRMLKKWIHATTSFGVADGPWMAGRQVLPETILTPLRAYGADVAEVGGFNLTAVDGTIPSQNSPFPYLEHRQFPRGRKEELG